MNSFVSTEAQIKLKELIKSAKAKGCMFSSWADGGVEIQYLFSSPLNNYIMLHNKPKIFVNESFFDQLHNQIHYDTEANEFVVYREK